MKAIIHTRYGPPEVLRLEEVEKPTPNGEYGVLVKVYASSVNPADRYEMLAPFIVRLIGRTGWRRPKDPRLGKDVAGRVEAVANSVTKFKPGDEVFGVCPGAYAEYATARETRLALKPADSTFEEAAASGIAAFTALQGLRDKGQIKPGQKVLINGAGGGVGTFAVQIAKSFGAEVTAVTNSDNLDMVRKIGADHVIDYLQEDFTKNGQHYDLICDIAATHSISDYKRALNPGGACVIIGFKNRVFLRLISLGFLARFWPKGGRRFVFFIAKTNQEDLMLLKGLIEQGKLIPVLDRSYPLSETAEAMRHLGTGHARGKIVIAIPQND